MEWVIKNGQSETQVTLGTGQRPETNKTEHMLNQKINHMWNQIKYIFSEKSVLSESIKWKY